MEASSDSGDLRKVENVLNSERESACAQSQKDSVILGFDEPTFSKMATRTCQETAIIEEALQGGETGMY